MRVLDGEKINLTTAQRSPTAAPVFNTSNKYIGMLKKAGKKQKKPMIPAG